MQKLVVLQIVLFNEHEQCRPQNSNLPLLHGSMSFLVFCKKTTKCYNTNSYTTLLYENIGKDEVAAFVAVRAKMKFKFNYQLQCLLQLVFSYLHLGSDMSTQKSIMTSLLIEQWISLMRLKRDYEQGLDHRLPNFFEAGTP